MSHSHRRLLSALATLATITGLVIAAPITAGADPGVPDHLAFTLQPASGTVDDTIHVTVEVRDDANLPVATATDQIKLTLSSGDFDAGTTSKPATLGSADFTGLEIHTPGTYTITASDTTAPSVTPAIGDEFTLAAGAPAQLKFDAQPSQQYSEVAMDPFTVDILDQYDNQTTSTDNIQLTLNTGSFSGGTPSKAAAGGVATFNDLTVLNPASYTITAHDTTTTGVTDDTSSSFDILPHADLQLTMSAATSQVAGTDAVYTVHVKNFGPNPNVSYTATGTLPTDVTFDGSQSGAGCGESGGTITCTRSGGVAVNATDNFDIALSLPANYVDGLLPALTRALSFTVTLTATSPTQDPNNTDPNGATVGRLVHGEADLDITQHDMQYVNLPASTFTPQASGNRHSVRYIVTVKNVGPSDAQNVTLADTLPTGALDVTNATVCLGGTCTPTSGYGNGSAFPTSSQPTLAPNGTLTVTFEAPVKTALRDRPNATNSVTAASPTADPGTDSDNRSNSRSDDITTVPDAPTLVAAEPGNASIAVQWQAGDNGTPSGDNGIGGSAITDWVIIVRAGATKNVYVRSDATGVTKNLTTGDISVVVPGSGGGAALTNNTNYNVTVAARNAAGDSTESNQKSAKPCLACGVTLVPSGGATTLYAFNTTITNGDCFPKSNVETAPGATSADPIVSCLKLTNLAAKAGFVAAVRELGSVSGDCGGTPCIGGQVSLSIPPGTGSSTAAEQAVVFDKTITTAPKNSDICNSTPCPVSKKVYDVFMNGAWIGSSLMTTWCSPSTPAGQPCVISYVHVNTSENPSKINGNTPNGKNGNGDLMLRVRIYADPSLGTCRTCR